MANKAMSNLSRTAEFKKEEAACYKQAYLSLLEAVGNFAKDNPEMDLVPLGLISTDISGRLQYQLEKAEMLRMRFR